MSIANPEVEDALVGLKDAILASRRAVKALGIDDMETINLLRETFRVSDQMMLLHDLLATSGIVRPFLDPVASAELTILREHLRVADEALQALEDE